MARQRLDNDNYRGSKRVSGTCLGDKRYTFFIISREDIFASTVYSRKYLLAKIFQIHFSRNFPPAKIKCYTVDDTV